VNVDSALGQLFFTTVRIETTTPTGTGFGSGFIFAHKTEALKDTGRSHLFLVTNKHVVKDATDGTIFLIKSNDDDTPKFGERVTMRFENFEARWYGHPDDAIDVTMMYIDDSLATTFTTGFYRSIPSFMIPADSTFEDLEAIEQVTFIGYPQGLYDTVNLIPIARRGVTATPPSINYEGKPQFLVDASVFPGSSGSPVFIVGPSFRSREKSLQYSDRQMFVGILAAGWEITSRMKADIVPRPTGFDIITPFSQMLGLGVVFKPSTIMETIESRFLLD
jgi:S1-C subfamily serine protease